MLLGCIWTMSGGNAALRGKRILLVEDDDGARQSIRLLLQIDRHEVVEATDGMEALRLFERDPFDLVVLDYFMAEMRGDELANRIRQLVPGQPLIMITAYSEKLSSAEKPVDCVLSKPFSISDLRKAIERVLASRR
jgi:CheY-like chemotaxis protein